VTGGRCRRALTRTRISTGSRLQAHGCRTSGCCAGTSTPSPGCVGRGDRRRLPRARACCRGRAAQAAIAEPLRRLRAALDHEHWFDVVGASKDLVEAACKVSIELGGETPSARADLIALAKEAQRVRGDDEAAPLSRSVVATVQRLAELRNDIGAGHGHSELPEVVRRAGSIGGEHRVCDFRLFPNHGLGRIRCCPGRGRYSVAWLWSKTQRCLRYEQSNGVSLHAGRVGSCDRGHCGRASW